MTLGFTGAARFCGEQDCNERTNYPLCYLHYQAFQGGDINECPNHAGVYKPSEFPGCRKCHYRNQQPAQPIRKEVGQQPRDDSRGWDQQPMSEPVDAPRPDVVEAVERVRLNLNKSESSNHESNTIQFLIIPILRALGWKDDDPHQVIREFKPAGKQRRRTSMAVDIALLVNGVPKVFLEAKRLDREYTEDYSEQLAKYASHLDNGIAVLTNGRYWQFYAVSNGKAELQRTIDIGKGDSRFVARDLDKAIGKHVINGVPARAALRHVSSNAETPGSVVQQSRREAIVENLRQYRERKRKQRHQPAFTIFNDETIEQIATLQPTDLRQLGNIRGIGLSTLQQHGSAIINVVLGEG